MSRILDLMKRFHLNEVEYIQDNKFSFLFCWIETIYLSIYLSISKQTQTQYLVGRTIIHTMIER
jgi:hypothetical protein